MGTLEKITKIKYLMLIPTGESKSMKNYGVKLEILINQ